VTYDEKLAKLSDDERLVWAAVAARARFSRSRTVQFDLADRFHDRFKELGLWESTEGGHIITEEAIAVRAVAPPKPVEDRSESPPEELLLAALTALLPRGMTLEQQVVIKTGRAAYRADFILNGGGRSRVVVEVDSIRHHSTFERMVTDRRRDRSMAALGILTLRFMATEVFESPEMCAFEAIEIAEAWSRDVA